MSSRQNLTIRYNPAPKAKVAVSAINFPAVRIPEHKRSGGRSNRNPVGMN